MPSNLTIFQNKSQEYLKKGKKYPAPNKVKFTVSGIQVEITRDAEWQENMSHTEEKHKSVRTDTDVSIRRQGH